MDEEAKAKLTADCSCGSGKKAGACCMSGEACACGSGKTAGECCFASAESMEEHGVEGGEEGGGGAM